MATDKNIFDNWLKRNANAASQSEVPVTWDMLEDALNKKDNSKRKAIWFYRIAGSLASLLLLALILSVVYTNKFKEKAQSKSAILNEKVENRKNEIEIDENQKSDLFNDELSEMNLEKVSINKNEILPRIKRSKTILGGRNMAHDDRINERRIASQNLSRKYEVIETLSKKNISNLPIEMLMNLPTKRNYKRTLTSQKDVNLWELGFSVSPSLGATLIKSDAENGWKVYHRFNGINKNSVFASLSNQVKFDVNRYLNKKKSWYIGAGMSYIQRQEQVKYSHIIDRVITLNIPLKKVEGGPMRPSFLWDEVNYTGSNTYQFLQTPVHLGNAISIRSNIKLRTEVSLNYTYTLGVTGTKISPTYLTLMEIENMSKHNLMGGIKSGLYYDYKNKFEFGFTPFYQRMFTGLSSGTNGIVENTSLYGVNFNIIYKLKS